MGAREVKASGSPQTIAGRWLVATILGRWDLRDELVGQLRAGALRSDELAVLKEAASFALREHFGGDYDVRSVAEFAASLRDSWQLPSGLGLIELEAVVRGALGEFDVDVTGIAGAARAEAYFFSVMLVARLREWDERALDELTGRAEDVAVSQGWKPQLARS